MNFFLELLKTEYKVSFKERLIIAIIIGILCGLFTGSAHAFAQGKSYPLSHPRHEHCRAHFTRNATRRHQRLHVVCVLSASGHRANQHERQQEREAIAAANAANEADDACTGWLVCDPTPEPCKTGEAECYEPEPRQTFPIYGNNELGDCEYAAAADWEIVALGIEPSEGEVIADYESGQSPDNGVWHYWETSGIDGIYAAPGHLYISANGETSHSTLRTLVRADGAIIAAMVLPSGPHYAVVDGFTPHGPLLATWGTTEQWTWHQWTTRASEAITVELRATPSVN